MKALVLAEYNRLVYTDFPDPEIHEDEVLINVKACGICGSDVHGMDGSTGRRIPPLIMGHEASGIIVQKGEKVRGWNEGDRVTFDSTIYPPDDWYAVNGQYNLSDKRQVLGVSPGDYKRHGAFAEYVTVPEHVLYRVPKNVSFEEAAMVEPVAVAAHSINVSRFSKGDNVLVVGTGMIGCFIINLLKVKGAGKIIAVDKDPDKEEMAVHFGADIFLDSSSGESPKKIINETYSRGVDLVIEAVGLQDSVQIAIEGVRKGGFITLVGNLSPKIEVPLQEIVTRQLTIQGSCAINGEYAEVLQLMQNQIIDVRPMISKIAPLRDGAEWFDRLYREEKGLYKVILIP